MREDGRILLASAFVAVLLIATAALLWDPDSAEKKGETVGIDGFEFERTGEGTAEMIRFYNEERFDELRIPSSVEIDGTVCIVTSIGVWTLTGYEDIGRIVIPDTVTSIGAGAFMSSNIGEAVIPSSVKTVGTMAFSGCCALKKIVFEGNPEKIAGNAFGYSTSLDEVSFGAPGRYSAHDGLVLEDDSLFFVTASIGGHLDIPEVESVGRHAFASAGISTVTIPKTVTRIGEAALVSPNLEEIHVDPDNPVFASVDGVLFTKDLKTLVAYPAGRTGSYTVPDAVESIAACAFEKCYGLESITIGANVQYIDEDAFGDIGFYESEESEEWLECEDIPGYTYVMKDGRMIRVE